MTTRKIDGYYAWHPEKGWRFDLMAKIYSEALDIACRSMGYYEDNDYGGGPIDSEDFTRAGWLIKPVRLIDPARLDQLEKIEKWAKEAVEMMTPSDIGEHYRFGEQEVYESGKKLLQEG